jgi:hypothetical protein
MKMSKPELKHNKEQMLRQHSSSNKSTAMLKPKFELQALLAQNPMLFAGAFRY